MKILKYILIVIGVLVIIFFGKGMLAPTVSHTCEVTVNKPVKECWAVMSDTSKMDQWILGFKRTELISGENNTVGAVSNVYVVDNGQEMVMTETITAIKENEQMAMNFSMDFMNMDYEMLFEEKDGKTIITSNTSVEGNGIFAKSLVSFMGGAMKEQEVENMNNLKKVIEENTTNYFPEPVIEDVSDSTAVDSTEILAE